LTILSEHQARESVPGTQRISRVTSDGSASGVGRAGPQTDVIAAAISHTVATPSQCMCESSSSDIFGTYLALKLHI